MGEQQAFEVIEHIWIPMPDDSRLSARLWLPERQPSARVPVVVAQAWSNGRVGMRGISWGGINTLMIAAPGLR